MKFAIALLMTLCSAAPPLGQPVEIGSAPGKLVDIGGHKLHLNCTDMRFISFSPPP